MVFDFFSLIWMRKTVRIMFFWIISREKWGTDLSLNGFDSGDKTTWIFVLVFMFLWILFFLVRVHFFSGWCTWEKNKAWMLASDLFGFDILFWVWPKREKCHGSWFHVFRLYLNERKHLGLVSRLPFSQSADWFCFASYMIFETQSNLVGFSTSIWDGASGGPFLLANVWCPIFSEFEWQKQFVTVTYDPCACQRCACSIATTRCCSGGVPVKEKIQHRQTQTNKSQDTWVAGQLWQNAMWFLTSSYFNQSM